MSAWIFRRLRVSPPGADGIRYWAWGDPGLVRGAIISAVIGFIFWLLFLRFSGTQFVAIPLGIGLGGFLFFGGLHKVPVAYRGVLLVLGIRVRVGEDKMGYKEGWVWVPLPVAIGLAAVIDVNTKLRAFPDPNDPDTPRYKGEIQGNMMDLADYAKGRGARARMHLLLFYQFRVCEPYLFQSQEDPFISLTGLVERATRYHISQHTPDQLVTADKVELSEQIYESVTTDTKKGSSSSKAVLEEIGLELGILRVTNIIADKDLEDAWKQPIIEKFERKAEKIEANAQVEQVTALRAIGVSPNTAVAVRLLSQGKEGAKLHQVNVEGVGPKLVAAVTELGKGLGSAGAAVGKTSGKTPRKRQSRRPRKKPGEGGEG